MTRLVALTLCAWLAGCASGPEPKGDPAGATLELVNRTREDIAVDVRGRVEATVHPGARARIYDLRPGTASVFARSVAGGAGAFEQRDMLTLKRGERTTWVVMPDAAGGEPLPEPPALATLIVTNTLPAHVRVTLDGVALGRVFAGETRSFTDLSAGPHTIAAQPDDDTAGVQTTLELAPGGDTAWSVAAVGGVVRIENRTGEALIVSIDGNERMRVAPDGQWRGTVPLGTHVFSAVSEPSRRPFESTLTIAADSEASWVVTSGQAALVIDNQTGEAITATVSGQTLAVARGAQLVVTDIPTGPQEIHARGDSGMTYAGRIDLAPGQRAHWIAERVMGSVRVVNRTGRRLWLYTRAVGRAERETGVLVPDLPAIVRDLPRGAINLIAIDPVGKRRYTSAIDLAEVPAGTWTILPTSGSLAVRNERDEPVTVYANAQRIGDIPADEARVFPGIGVGAVLVESIGQRTGYTQSHRATITEERVAEVTLPDPSAFVLVENATGESLATRDVLADQVASLAPGSVTRFRVRTGMARLTVVGEDTGLVYQADVEASSQAPARWIVRLTPATLVVWNERHETLAITVDDRAVGSVAPDQSLTLDGLAPGRHTVQAIGLGSGQLESTTLALAPGAEERLSFGITLAALVVENRSAEVVVVTVDGKVWGDVAPGAAHGFANLPIGKHRVDFDYQQSHRRSATDIEAREGQRVLVVAEVPLALVVVQNGSRQATRVLIDGVAIATIPADAPPSLVHIPAGPRLVQFERMQDRTIVSFSLEFWADAAIHLPIPPASARLVVVNREAHPVEIRFGELAVGRIEANSSMIFEDLPDTTNTLTARRLDGSVTHTELRTFEAGETGTWVLDPMPVSP